MSAQTIAWHALVAVFAVALLAECLRRYLVRRNRPLTASEWLAEMRKLPQSPPPRRTQEAKADDLDAELREMMRENRGSE
jgi:hypothetical protein